MTKEQKSLTCEDCGAPWDFFYRPIVEGIREDAKDDSEKVLRCMPCWKKILDSKKPKGEDT